MQFLRALILSAVLYASASFAATIPRGTGEDVEITIKIHPVAQGGNVGFTKQLVFPTINNFLSAHIFVSCRTLSSLTNTNCSSYRCHDDADCPGWCGGCDQDTKRVCFTFCQSPGITNWLIFKIYSACPRGVEPSY